MSYFQPKDSLYQIQPWADESSTIPNCFLHTKHFAKTATSSKFHTKLHQNLEIAANTVYFIKNQPEETELGDKKRKRYHRTAQNSQRFAENQDQSPETNGINREKHTNATLSNLHYNKKQAINPEKKIAFHHTKNLVFEITPLKKKGNSGNRKLSLAVDSRKSLEKNLLKIYQKSVVGSQQKKTIKHEKSERYKPFDKRKIKTQSAEERQPLKFQLSSTMHFKEDITPIQTQQKVKNINSALSKTAYVRKQPSQKRSFQLLVERKLYLLNHKLESPQKQKGLKNSFGFRLKPQF